VMTVHAWPNARYIPDLHEDRALAVTLSELIEDA
jgi:hypothetical protein